MDALLAVFYLAIFALTIFVWMRIVGKTGNNQWLGLLVVVPIANIGLLLWLAFSEWPLEKQARTTTSEDLQS